MFERFENASGFVFDCDGTLLDTMKIWREVELELIDMAGGHISQEDFIELQAVSIDDGAKMLHERYGAGSSAQELVEYVDRRLLGFYRNEVEPFEGAVEFVLKLRERGVPCSIVSSSPVRYIEAGFTRCGLIDELACLVSTETAGVGKQDPAIYQLAVDKMGADIKTSWGVDDSLYAVKAMAASGLNTLAIYCDDKAGTMEQLGEHADIVFTRFAELLD